MNIQSVSKVPYNEIILPGMRERFSRILMDDVVTTDTPNTATEKFNALIARMNSDLQSRMSKRTEAAQQQGEKSKQEGAPTGWEFEFEVTLKEQRWVFNKPTFAMRTQTWSFDWPELRGRDASFDIPDGLEWRNESRYLGDFWQCKGSFPNISCGWWPVYADIPVAVVKTKRVILTVPEVVTQRKEFKWDVPEFYTEEVVWILNVPEFKLIRSAATYAEEAQKEADKIESDTKLGIKEDVDVIRSTYKDELFRLASEVGSETRDRLTKEYNVNLGLFNGAIEGMQLQINALPEGERAVYTANLNQWITNRQSFVDQYVQFMQNLDSQIQGMVKKVLDSLGQSIQ